MWYFTVYSVMGRVYVMRRDGKLTSVKHTK